jgi:hypothetical protein
MQENDQSRSLIIDLQAEVDRLKGIKQVKP